MAICTYLCDQYRYLCDQYRCLCDQYRCLCFLGLGFLFVHTLNLHRVTTTNLSVWSFPRISSLHKISSWREREEEEGREERRREEWGNQGRGEM